MSSSPAKIPSAAAVKDENVRSVVKPQEDITIATTSAKEIKSGVAEGQGLVVPRRFTSPGINPLDQVEYDRRRSVITERDGSVVFEMNDVEAPHNWSQLATDIVASKYFRKAGIPGMGHENSVRQAIYRVAHTIRDAGEEQGGYFADEESADTFEAELIHLLVNQKVAFNSPVWFNCGLHHQYGITGSGGNWAWDAKHSDFRQTTDSYSRPQCSACFIQSVDDDLMSIFDLVKNEARIFKFGSGTGTNFSKIRGCQEKLSGGGTSSGLMSFLEIFDRGAGATKSGGTTRRAAKMVCLDMDHPEIKSFINWKRHEEKKAKLLIASGMPADMNGEAYRTVSGQNSNNSVRITDEFMQAVLNDGEWQTTHRLSGEVCDTYRARELWDDINKSAWACADPGLQFDTNINHWHTSANTDKIHASNPCSEFMFLDDSACNLASLNLTAFLGEKGHFDIDAFRHACRVTFIAQEILVDFSSYPTRRIARNSHRFRPLGLGYANLGTMLMLLGVPYDSEEGRALAGAVTAIMTGHAYRTSAEMSAAKEPFKGFDDNRQPMLRVMRQHRDAIDAIDTELCPEHLLAAARQDWSEAIALGEQHGYRNAQTTVLAPTGTIGLLMDCDTTGIEPEFALVKFKKLAGGGYFKIANQSVRAALKRLGYSRKKIEAIVDYMEGTMTLEGAPHINSETLAAKGLSEEDLETIEAALPGAFELSFAINPIVLGAEALERLGLAERQTSRSGFSILKALGYTARQIEEANRHVCGRMTIEGAPDLKPEHLPVFDCASKNGKVGQRFIAPMGHINMMAAAQPFISGAISKTVNVPNETAVEEIGEIYLDAWRKGLKAVALYRDGCKMCQPLNVNADDDDAKTDDPPAEQDPFEAITKVIERTVYVEKPPTQRKLPPKRTGFTQEARVGGHKIFLRTGEYEDGTLGEIFIDMAKEGAALRTILSCFSIAISKGLQYGVPLKEFVDTFTFTRFEPQGVVDHPNIKMATSVIDYVFRVLAMEYLGRHDLCQVPPEAGDDVAAILEQEQDQAAEKTDAAADDVSGINAVNSLSAFQAQLMQDAPFCDVCGNVTVRSGSCYKCTNCGNSMGCS